MGTPARRREPRTLFTALVACLVAIPAVLAIVDVPTPLWEGRRIPGASDNSFTRWKSQVGLPVSPAALRLLERQSKHGQSPHGVTLDEHDPALGWGYVPSSLHSWGGYEARAHALASDAAVTVCEELPSGAPVHDDDLVLAADDDYPDQRGIKQCGARARAFSR